MSKRNEKYWLERLLQDSAKIYNFSEGQLRKLRREYEKAVKTINKQLKAGDDSLKKLKEKLLAEIDRLMEYEEALTKETLLQVYEEGFYRSTFNIQQALGYGTDYIFLAPNIAETAIGIAWSGKNYSERIWQHRELLAKKIEKILTQGTILGHSNAKMAKQLADEMNSTFSNAARLIRTETNYIYNQSSKAGYEQLGIVQYQFLATLDLRTSVICASLDGKKFYLKDAQAGLNYPPMHPNCRSTTIPVAEYDAEEVRLAKLNGTYYKVPAIMTYEQWYRSIVKKHGAEKVAIMKKMVQNELKDRTLYEAFKKSIGVDAPRTFKEFQEIKYNNSKQWEALQRQRATFEKIKSKDYTEQYRRKMMNLYRYFKNHGLEFTDHSLNRVLGQKISKNKRSFTKKDVLELMKKHPNFKQGNDRLIWFDNGLAIIRSSKTNEIVSVVTRKSPSVNWEVLK